MRFANSEMKGLKELQQTLLQNQNRLKKDFANLWDIEEILKYRTFGKHKKWFKIVIGSFVLETPFNLPEKITEKPRLLLFSLLFQIVADKFYIDNGQYCHYLDKSHNNVFWEVYFYRNCLNHFVCGRYRSTILDICAFKHISTFMFGKRLKKTDILTLARYLKAKTINGVKYFETEKGETWRINRNFKWANCKKIRTTQKTAYIARILKSWKTYNIWLENFVVLSEFVKTNINLDKDEYWHVVKTFFYNGIDTLADLNTITQRNLEKWFPIGLQNRFVSLLCSFDSSVDSKQFLRQERQKRMTEEMMMNHLEEFFLPIQKNTLPIPEKQILPEITCPRGKDDEATDETPDQDVCVVCLTNLRKTITLPCAHISLCFACSEEWLKTNKLCVECRGPITSVKKFYKN